MNPSTGPHASSDPRGIGQKRGASPPARHRPESPARPPQQVSDRGTERRPTPPTLLVPDQEASTPLPLINVKRHRVDPKALSLVPEDLARRHRVIPLQLQGNGLVVAMADTEDLQAIEDLHAQAGLSIIPVLAAAADIQEAFDLYYRVTGEIAREVQQIALTERDNPVVATESVARTPIVRTVDLLLDQALRDRASDIHLEPQTDRLRIRFRIDGILHEAVSLPLGAHAPLISRLKIMAGMNIAERRLPQDGQFSLHMQERDVDVRAATADTVYGEMMVLRLLDKSVSLLSLSDLGFLPDILARYQRMLKSTYGMLLVCGPTGSGKTTTLYASVNQMDRQERKVITIEDPVEYRFPDINGIQVNPKAGLTFAIGLRAIMRLDPDVILVGEVRDADTARTAVEAALTGHLVLSSIHANDSVGAIFRLLNLGVDPSLVASAVVGVVGQRMVRRVCPHCRTQGAPSPEDALACAEVLHEAPESVTYGVGCQVDAGTGYLGRTGIFELLVLSEDLRRLVAAGASAGDIAAQAAREGTVPMLKDGMLKAKMGITTIAEVLRNAYSLG